MSPKLRILIVEDSADDAELIAVALKRGGLAADWTRVDTAEALKSALAVGGWHAIVSDYTLPDFNAITALEIVRGIDPDLPFVVVSGTVGEEIAAATVRAGANDFVLKHNLVRLAPALNRELREADNRRARRSAEHLRQDVLDSIASQVAVLDDDGVILNVNAAWEQFALENGATSSGIGTNYLAICSGAAGPYSEEAAPVAVGITKVLHKTATSFSMEYPCDTATQKSWFLVQVAPLQLAGSGAVVSHSDITVRKHAEAERIELLDFLKLQIERMPLAYLLSGPDFRYTRWNPAAEHLFGYSEAEVLGKHPFELIVPPKSQPMVEEIFAKLAAGDMNANGTSDNITKDRRTILCEWHNTPLFNRNGVFQGILSLAQDVTARKILEEQFRQAQKMEAFGQLAGGVAHDFNNLLTIITGYSDLLLQSLSKDDPNLELIAEIHKAGERSVGLTRQLLAFSRQQVLAPKILDLNEVVAGTEKMLRRLIGEDILVVANLETTLWTVRADPGQIEQVLMNLAVNARDAMPRGGVLTIETRNVDLDTPLFADTRTGPHVLLAVTDTGCGMTPEVQAKIFEPFFTTKGSGKGTGLGLATVFGIVKQSGGNVVVTSEVGVGTSFQVYLPKVERGAKPAESRSWNRGPARGTETILVVEDEDGVRALTKHILSACGYTVLEASEGVEAIRIADEHLDRIHMVITDVVMPGEGGRVVAERIALKHPAIKVLFVSGYTDDAVIRHGVVDEGVHFLQKPFAPSALAAKVREVLDEHTR